MNLFTETIAEYLKSEWDRVMDAPHGIKEARFITESMSPESTFELFSELEEHRLKKLQKNQNILQHFRAATGLWREWVQRGKQVILIEKMTEQSWVDLEDKQTYYRNAVLPDDRDGLVVILVGLNHASDKGSLSDFHLVNEDRVWQLMEQGYATWIMRLCERYNLEPVEADISDLDKALTALFSVRPRRLARLAEFIDTELLPVGSHIESLSEVVECFYQKLAFWDIAPILSFGSNKKDSCYVKESENFISHQNFKAFNEQKKSFEKLETALIDGKLEVPDTVSNMRLYENDAAYLETLRAFIFDADAEAKNRLMQTNVYEVLKILKKPKKKDRGQSSDKISALSGYSVDVFLQAIWITWEAFEENFDGRFDADAIQSVHITADIFYHDLNNDFEAGLDGDSLAKEILTGCLGGLDKLLSAMDLRLPIDADQASLPRESWTKHIPVEFELDVENGVIYNTSQEQPHIRFRIDIAASDNEKSISRYFKWNFGPNHPERVRYSCARSVLDVWKPLKTSGKLVLPAYQLPDVVMTALYFSGDEEEANRLVSQALTEMKIINLVDDINKQDVDGALWADLDSMISAYLIWLEKFVNNGYYEANSSSFLSLQQKYELFAKNTLDRTKTGQLPLLRRLYKAFMLVDGKMKPNDAYLRSAAVCGISPSVLELSDAQARFLADSFPEVLAEQAVGGNGRVSFNRLINLVEIQRPLAALVVDVQRTISSEIKSFGLLHYFGPVPSTEVSLAVQTLLRDEEFEDDVTDIVRPSEESAVVVRVLKDYLQLHSFAEDGLRILAVNVEDLATILSGVDRFLREYIKSSPSNWPAFQCEVMIYSTSSSPLAVESKLEIWRDHVMEAYRESGRAVVLSVGHHFASSKKQMETLIEKERRLYDIAFLMHFLTGELHGDTESALPFEYDFNSISKFPICEYPRPIQKDERWHRQSLLSNRRLRIQTRHADLSARLRNPESQDNEHLVFGRVDYQPWQLVVESLHKKAQWVACIDPFVDKRLLGGNEANGQRKIVGFTSGLGAYGELNLSISTEQDTLTQLTTLVKSHLKSLIPFQQEGDFDAMSVKIVDDAEEIIGLSSLRAVIGDGEKIREVVGFAAIYRALDKMVDSAVTILLPVDSVMHWFAGSDVTHRPDLLQLSLILREGDIPLIQATIIECKLALKNPEHLTKAIDQVHDGLSHLTQLFAPNRKDVPRVSFDRRYWWAQLHRAITSRAVVTLTEEKRKILDSALERLAEGYYEITWKGGVFTFWTDEPGPVPVLTSLPLRCEVINPHIVIPNEFSIWHVAMGREGLVSLFTNKDTQTITFEGAAIRLRPMEKTPSDTTHDIGVNVSSSTITSDYTSPITSNIVEPIVGNAVDHVFVEKSMRISSVSQLEAGQASTITQVIESIEEIAQPTLTEVAPEIMTPSVSMPLEITPVINTLPSKLLIGTKNNGDAVYWHYGHPKLANRHMLIFGASGSGKTYGIQCLLAEMAKANLHSLIVDYTDGFLPNQVESTFNEVAKLKNNYVYTEKLPLNPFEPQKKIIDPSLPAFSEKPFDVATRVASIFTSVFSSMGDQQSAVLIRILEAGISQGNGFSLDDVLALLRADDSQSGESLASKLEPFIRSQPFREGSDSTWKEMLTSENHWVNVLQLTGLARDIQKLVTEFALWNLYDYACNTGNKNRPIPLVLDEIQNLDHRSDSPIDKMLREGRKFGLSLILATQTTSQFDQEQRDRLFQAGHKLFFKPASSEIPSFAALLSVATGETKASWGERLSRLEKGQCWSFGPVLTSSGALKEKAELVYVTALEDRGFNVA